MEEANLNWRYVDGSLIMPWYTMPVLQWLKNTDTTNWNVVEFGSGYSTIWWRLNCKRVFSIDHNKYWSDAMGAKFAISKKDYVEFSGQTSYIENGLLFDCIIVDGEYRDECVEACLKYIKSGGHLIIDNYEQQSVDGCDFSRVNELLSNWGKIVHRQYNHSDWQTAIFTKP